MRDVYQKAKSSCPEVLKLGILVEGEREKERDGRKKEEKRRRMRSKFEDGRGCENKEGWTK